ncbi:MAG: hypothetical protein K9K86_02265 [Pseudomonadales bacterium]|nr:hypothetical protein [Pseudomonadales bacterium]
MKRIILKSLICGFVVGTILFAIAPLGLGISLIEILKPVMVPGIVVTQLILGDSVGVLPIAIALLINGVIFTIPFAAFFYSSKQ